MAGKAERRWVTAQRSWLKVAERSARANQLSVDHSRAIAKAELAAARAGANLVAIQRAAIRQVRRELKAAGYEA